MRSRRRYARLMGPLEDPGKYYWKWFAIGGGLLIVYAIERFIRLGALF